MFPPTIFEAVAERLRFLRRSENVLKYRFDGPVELDEIRVRFRLISVIETLEYFGKLNVLPFRLLILAVVRKCCRVVEKEYVVPLELDRLLVRRTRVLKIVQFREGDAEVHVAGRKIRLEIDGCREVMEGARVLAGVQMHEPEIVRDYPLEGLEI